jgi:hypothetical protein
MRFCLLLCFVMIASTLFAQVEQITAVAGAVNCPVCFKTAEVMLGQLPPVQVVTSDLASRRLSIAVKPNQSIAVRDVLERIKVAAPNTLFQIDITAVGKVVSRDGKFFLAVPSQSESFQLDSGQRAQAVANFAQNQRSVRVGGLLQESHDGYKLSVLRLQKID